MGKDSIVRQTFPMEIVLRRFRRVHVSDKSKWVVVVNYSSGKRGLSLKRGSGTGQGRQGTALALAPCSVPEEMLKPPLWDQAYPQQWKNGTRFNNGKLIRSEF